MSIEEFYEQRAKDGWFQSSASGQGAAASTQMTEDDVAAEKEAKEDDPEELARQRGFDEYKDEHKRGEGNRHNRGWN